MALPKLNDMPMYPVIIPSTQQEVRIRPFVVKEEKILLIAMESQDPKQIAGAILDTIVSCTENKVEPKSLTAYDVEYMFMQIRGKSVGETSTVNLACDKCEERNEVKINISDIKINSKIPESRITLTDKIIVEMKPPSYMQIAQSEKILGENSNATDRLFGLIIEFMDAVLTDDERIAISDIPHEEAIEFLESMTSDQFGKIREYIENQPMLKHDVDYNCEHCGHQNNIRLEGLQDFF